MRFVIFAIIIILIAIELGTIGLCFSGAGGSLFKLPTPVTPSTERSPVLPTPAKTTSIQSPALSSPTAAPSATKTAATASPQKPVESEVSGALNKGIEHYKAMDYEKAIACLMELTEKNPDNVLAHYYLFLSHVQIEENPLSRNSLAYKEAQVTLKLEPEETIKTNIKAYLQDVKSREGVAIDKSPAPKVKMTQSPTPVPSPSEEGSTPPPLELSPAIPTITSKDADLHYERGRNYDKLGNYNFALAEYSNAIKINPKHYDAYIGRGSLYESKSNYSDAVRDYSKAIGIRPGDAKTYYRRGMAYKNLDDKEHAKADLAKAKEIDPTMTEKIDALITEMEKGKDQKKESK